MSDQGQVVYSGRYELHQRLARGGMADVYLARDHLLDRPVAVKVLFPEFATDPSFVERFRREAQAAANLAHPNVVGVYDWGEEEGGTYFIVMEYVEGRSLSEIIRSEGGLHPQRAAEIAADIAAALAFAHQNGVVHRDVKPGNVIITPGGQVKVADFGIARAAIDGADQNLTKTGAVMGTATYFSPEQAQGRPVDPRSDIYSLGIVMYEMATGRPPFSGDSPVSIAYKHVQEQPVPPRQLNPDVPPALEAVILKALAKNPANRYPSAEDLRADLQRFRSGQAVLAEPLLEQAEATQTQAMSQARGAYADGTRTMPAADYPPTGPPPRRTWAFFIVLAVLLVILAGLLFALWQALDIGGGAEQVAVPSVTQQREEEARRVLQEAGFEVDVDRAANEDVAEGVVFDQDPAGGVEAEEGSTIRIRVSAGPTPVTVPELVGRDQDDATAQLTALGLQFRIVTEPSDEDDEGIVLDQEPDAGEELGRGDTVNLVVSGGRPSTAVPDVIGSSLDDAIAELQGAGFRTAIERVDDDAPRDQVISTSPGPGSEAEEGSTVTVTVSEGPDEEETTTTTSTTATTLPTTTTAPPDDG